MPTAAPTTEALPGLTARPMLDRRVYVEAFGTHWDDHSRARFTLELTRAVPQDGYPPVCDLKIEQFPISFEVKQDWDDEGATLTFDGVSLATLRALHAALGVALDRSESPV